MGPIFKRNAAGNQAGGRPSAAVELSPEGVLAAALPAARSRHGASVAEKGCIYAFAPLPPGALVPGLDEPDKPNLRAPEAVASAIRAALSQVAPRTHAVTLVLPDTLVRVFVLDFDSMPAKAAEAVSVVRFRLRKMVPFDVEPAGVSYQVLAQNESECKVLAAIVPGPILAEYEAAVLDAGYEPGAVLSSSLAALEAADATEGVLAANLSARSMTTAVTSGQDLLLYRTLDLPPDPASRAAEIARSIAVAAAYFEDKLGAPPRRLYYAGIESPAEFAASIGNAEISVVAWAERPEEGALTALPQTSFAGVAGALAGAS
jgi:type IV pilus assembly protein PilM